MKSQNSLIVTGSKYVTLWVCILTVAGMIYIISEDYVKSREKQRAAAVGFLGLVSGVLAKLEVDRDKKLKAIEDLELDIKEEISKLDNNIRDELNQQEIKGDAKDEDQTNRITVLEEKLDCHIRSLGHEDTQKQLTKLWVDNELLKQMFSVVQETERKLNQMQHDIEENKKLNSEILAYLKNKTDFVKS